MSHDCSAHTHTPCVARHKKSWISNSICILPHWNMNVPVHLLNVSVHIRCTHWPKWRISMNAILFKINRTLTHVLCVCFCCCSGPMFHAQISVAPLGHIVKLFYSDKKKKTTKEKPSSLSHKWSLPTKLFPSHFWLSLRSHRRFHSARLTQFN